MKAKLIFTAAFIALVFSVLSGPFVNAMTKGEFEQQCGNTGGYVVESLDWNGNAINTYCQRGDTATKCEHLESTSVVSDTPCSTVGPANRNTPIRGRLKDIDKPVIRFR